jgi:tetratricopeptide (TPR) repeat protein
MKRLLIALLMALCGACLLAAPTVGKKASKPALEPASSGPAGSARAVGLLGLTDQQIQKLQTLQARSTKEYQAGQFDQAKKALQEMLAISPGESTAWYNLACVESRLGNQSGALADLNKALDFGYADFRLLEKDDDLAALRQTSGYKQVLARRDKVQQQRAGQIEQDLKALFGQACLYEIDHKDKLVFATTVDQPTLDDLKARLRKEAAALWSDLFANRLEQYVTVVVPSADYRTNNPFLAGGGYYDQSAKMLVARQVGMVLQHEFAHALHDADQDALGQHHPIWIIEGFSTLCESARFDGGHLAPLPSQRLNLLQSLQARGRLIPWSEFFKLEQPAYLQKAVVSYPQSRYILMYLYDKGVLGKWYRAYTAGYRDDPGGGSAMEKVLGQPLARIESDWKSWLGGLTPLVTALPANHAYLGVRTAMDTDGLAVEQVVGGSGADKAGLQRGDVITRIEQDRVTEPEALLLIVDAHQVGDKLEVVYRRDGKYLSTVVTLQAMPATLSERPRAARTSRPAR